VGLENRAERAEVAEHKSFATAKRLAPDPRAGLVDFAQLIDVAVAFQHQPAAAERIGDETIRAGVHVFALDVEHAIRVRKIPRLAAIAIREAREHELRAHGAVANEPPLTQGFEEGGFHTQGATRISVSVICNSTPAALAASCKAAWSITTGSLLTVRRRMRPSPFFGADRQRDFQAFAFATDARAIRKLRVHRLDEGVHVMRADAGFFGKRGGQLFFSRGIDVTEFGHLLNFVHGS